MATALQNLAALQQLFAPVGNQIANLNSAELAIAQRDAQRRQALENLAREEQFKREMEQAATARAITLANIQNAGQANREEAYLRRIDEQDKAARGRDDLKNLQLMRAQLQELYSAYGQAARNAGKEEIKTLEDFGVTKAATVDDLLAARSLIEAERRALEGNAADNAARTLGRQIGSVSQQLANLESLSQDEDLAAMVAAAQAIEDEDDREAAIKLIGSTQSKAAVEAKLKPAAKAQFLAALGGARSKVLAEKADSPAAKQARAMLANLQGIVAKANLTERSAGILAEASMAPFQQAQRRAQASMDEMAKALEAKLPPKAPAAPSAPARPQNLDPLPTPTGTFYRPVGPGAGGVFMPSVPQGVSAPPPVNQNPALTNLGPSAAIPAAPSFFGRDRDGAANQEAIKNLLRAAGSNFMDNAQTIFDIPRQVAPVFNPGNWRSAPSAAGGSALIYDPAR